MWNQEQQDDGFFEGSDAAASRGEGSDEGSDDETTSTGDLPDGLPLQAALQLQRGGAWAQVVGGTGGWSLTPPSFGVTFTGEWDRNLYNNIVAGLQKLTWVVYPKDNARLLYALALQYRRGDWMSHRTEEEVYLQELMPESFSKSLEDNAVNGWAPNIRTDILEACAFLLLATKERLGLNTGGSGDADEADVVPLLLCAALALESTTTFHQRHKYDALPQRMSPGVPEDWAVARDDGDALVEMGNTFVQQVRPYHHWLTFLINYGGQHGVFDAVAQAIENAETLTLRTLEACVKLLSKVAPWVMPQHQERLRTTALRALSYAERCVAVPDEMLPRQREQRERSLTLLSTLLRTLHTMLSAILGSSARATAAVLPVQRNLASAMLAAGTFNTQLAGVREINSFLDFVHPGTTIGPMQQPLTGTGAVAAASNVLLTLRLPGQGASHGAQPTQPPAAGMDNELGSDLPPLPGGFLAEAQSNLDADIARALANSQHGGGPSIPPPAAETSELARLAEEAVRWVNETGVLAAALRGALHLKQYTEQVERIMRCLLRAHALPDEHLALVWDMCQRADTFEETKANLFGMLASLAAEFTAAQLDVLFARFEESDTPSGMTASAADQSRMLSLITALAKGDATGAMAGRLTSLLWTKLSASRDPGASSAADLAHLGAFAGRSSTPPPPGLAQQQPSAMMDTRSRAVLDTLVEVCQHYSSRALAHSSLEELLVCCVKALQTHCGRGTTPVVSLLCRLMEQQYQQTTRYSAMTTSGGGMDADPGVARVRELSDRYSLVPLLLNDVCAYAVLHPFGGDGTRERLAFALNIMRWSGTMLSSDDAERLWRATVAEPAANGGDTTNAVWFADACQQHINLQFSSARTPVLMPDACRRVLSLVASIPPAEQTPATFQCAVALIHTLGRTSGTIENVLFKTPFAQGPAHVVRSLDFDGFSCMWDWAAGASHEIAAKAISWFADVFLALRGVCSAGDEQGSMQTRQLRKTFLEHATQKLQAAATAVLSPTASASGQQQHRDACEHVRRAMHLLQQLLIRDAAMYPQAALGDGPWQMHKATFRGRVFDLNLVSVSHANAQGAANQNRSNGGSRVFMRVGVHEYFTSLRDRLAEQLSIEPARVRIIGVGTDLSSAPMTTHNMCNRLEGVQNITFVIKPEGTSAAAASPSMDVGGSPTRGAGGAADATSPAAPGPGAGDPQDRGTPPSTPQPGAPPPPSPASPAPAPQATASIGGSDDAQHVVTSARQLVAAVPGVYDSLLSLADCPTTEAAAAVCDGALELLGLLPTQAEMRARVRAILDKSTSDSEGASAALAALLSTSVSRRAYALQILESILYPVNGCADPVWRDWVAVEQAAFDIKVPKCVFDALHPRNVPPNTSACALRTLFSTGFNVFFPLLRRRGLGTDAPTSIGGGDHMMGAFQAAVTASGSVDTLDMLAWLLPRVARGFAPLSADNIHGSGTSLGEGNNNGAAVDTSMDSGAVMTSDVDGEAMAVSSGCGIAVSKAQAALTGHVSSGTSSAPWSPAALLAARSVYDDEGGLLPDDVYLIDKALVFFHAVGKQVQPTALARVLARPDAAMLLTSMLLQCPAEKARTLFTQICLDLVGCLEGNAADSSAGAATRARLLHLLLSLRSVADSDVYARTCRQFFVLTELLLIRQATDRVGAPGAFDEVLTEEVHALLTSSPCTDAEDGRLTGHLQLVTSLVRGTCKRGIQTPSGVPLLTVLLKRFLFPETDVLAAMQEAELDHLEDDDARGRHAHVMHDAEAEAVSLTAIASTPSSRKAALTLVVALATRDPAALQVVADVVRVLHFHINFGTTNGSGSCTAASFERSATSFPRPDKGFVGLINGGATCYMNSVFQQLFMQPSIRRGVLEASDAGEAEPGDSVLCQLQSTFGALLASQQDAYKPEKFWSAFKDYDGQPVNVREHQDALEFMLRLQDQVDAAIKRGTQLQQPGTSRGQSGALLRGDMTDPLDEMGAIERVLGGVLVTQVVCSTCPAHRSERDEPGNSLAVDIRNKSGLLESLAAYVQGELLEGDNKWECERCGHKVDAVKRQVFKRLPHTLCFQLKRFEYDYETMQRLKVKDRFEFPQELDMRPFTVDDDPNAAQAHAPMPDWYYKYTLMGVVVHSGTAFAGHYYSYVRERLEPPTGSPPGTPVQPGPWYVFDDRRVEAYDSKNLERDTFGGKWQGWDPIQQKYGLSDMDLPNSAYMLFFERLGEPSSSGESAKTAVAMHHSRASGGDYPRAAPSAPMRLPLRVALEVKHANAECVFETHVLSKEYFEFMYQLVEANMEASATRKRPRHAQRGPSSAHAAGGAMSSGDYPSAAQQLLHGAGSSSQSQNTRCEELLAEICATFLFYVFSRSGASLHDDTSAAAWVSMMTGLVDNSAAACYALLRWLTHSDRSIALWFLLARCPFDSTRDMWRQIISAALRACVSHGGGADDLQNLFEVMSEYTPLEESEDGDAADEASILTHVPSPTLSEERAGGGGGAMTGFHQNSPGVVLNAMILRLLCIVMKAAKAKRPFKTETYMASTLQILHEYATLGVVQRAHLVNLRTVSAVTDYCRVRLQSDSWGGNSVRGDGDGSARIATHVAMHALMSQLVRGMGGPYRTETSPRARRATSSAAGFGQHRNPFALSMRLDGEPEGDDPDLEDYGQYVTSMEEETVGLLLYSRGQHYLDLLREASLWNPDARQLLLYICFDRGDMQRWVIVHMLLKLADTTDGNTLHAITELFTALLDMDDNEHCQEGRVYLMFQGSGNSRMGGRSNGLFELLGSSLTQFNRRLYVMRWLVPLLRRSDTLPVLHEALGNLVDEWSTTLQDLNEAALRLGASLNASQNLRADAEEMMTLVDEARGALAAYAANAADWDEEGEGDEEL